MKTKICVLMYICINVGYKCALKRYGDIHMSVRILAWLQLYTVLYIEKK